MRTMRKTKARRARRVHPSVNAALEAINANNRTSQHHSVASARPNQPALRSRSREVPLAEVNSTGQQDISRNPHTFPQVGRLPSIRDHPHSLNRSGATYPAVPTPQYQRTRRQSQINTHWQASDPSDNHSQNSAWHRLPIAHRMFSLLLGFLSMYYFLFAKHHHYDKEIVAIHADVEKLLSQANESILGENLVEAVLPDIFKESKPLPLSPTPTAKQVPGKKAIASIENASLSTAASAVAKRNSSSPLKIRKRKKKQSSSKQHTDVKKEDVDKQSSQSDPSLTSSVPEQAKGSITSNGTSATSSESVSKANAEYSELDSPRTNVSDSSVTQKTNGNDSAIHAGLASGDQSKQMKPDSQSAPLNTSGIANSTTQPSSNSTKPEERYDYSLDFKDLDGADLPKGHVPVLDWNYEAVIDQATTEQIFASGDKLHHVAAYKPLCIEAATGEAISFSGKRVCSGFNRTSQWMTRYCDVLKASLPRENLLKIKDEKPHEWLQEHDSQIEWIDGLTVLQIMEKNCGNIAHFAGRILLMQHIIDNIAAYASPPSTVENVLILPTWDIMKRFLYPHNYDFWHKSVFSALVAPARFTIGTLGNFIYRERKHPYSGVPRVQLLHNFSLSGGSTQEKNFVCFRRVIVPGYLKGRFFADDIEYPSKKPSLQSSVTGAPRVPRDSLRFREKISALFHQTPHFTGMHKEVVFLDRNGTRRVLSEKGKSDVIDMFRKVSSEKGYNFKVISFDHMTFKQQYETMKGASIAIGIHGANLVNAMLMPPLSVLIELFPFGFMHDMYANGGNSGLKYYKYQMRTGLPFEGPKRFRSVEQCIKLNHQCKVHFRDSVLQVTSDDLREMEQILQLAFVWCNERPQPNLPEAAAQRAGSKSRRRRRLLDLRTAS